MMESTARYLERNKISFVEKLADLWFAPKGFESTEMYERIGIRKLKRYVPSGGEIAILSATSTAPNQNAWIAVMKADLQKSQYSMLKLDDVVYGNDDDTMSYTQAQGLLQKYPNLKVIIAPTTVGIAASARAVSDAKLAGKVFVTGLGTPNQMRDYVKSGVAPEFALWNPGDLGYLSVYTLYNIATGKIKGAVGDSFTAGKLGQYTVVNDPDNGPMLLLGQSTIFNKDNIDNFNF